jgi:TPP-dependent pyruvate/acetoin dehydrogenase alpha subunit
VLFLCENNLYAMGTALARSESQRDLHLKAASYGLRSEVVAGMDVFTVENALRDAAAHVREGRGPVFLEIRTYRFRAHSMFDAQLYRDKAEVEEWQQKGPILTLRNWLEGAGLMSEGDYERLRQEADDEVQRAVEFAEGSEWEPVEDLQRHVYAEAEAP